MNRKAFTLIELLVVISIVGLLSSAALASVASAREKARFAAALNFERQVHNQLQADDINNLLVEYNFDGDNLNDASGNNYTGTLQGDGVIYSEGVNSGRALSLAGSSDYVDLPSTFTRPVSATHAMWVYPISYNAVLFTYLTHGVNTGYAISINASGYITTYIHWGAGTVDLQSDRPVPLNKRTHVAHTYGVGGQKLYINGVKQLDEDADARPPYSSFINSKQIGGSAGPTFFGRMDNIRIYQKSYQQ